VSVGISENAEFEARREQMVCHQIEARGVTSPRVLEAMRAVRREGYVPSYLGEFAYEDTPLPIAAEQTISQPYIVGFMIEAMGLREGDRVLEVGTGSGYAAAVLAEIASEVYTIERHAALARGAEERLRRDGYEKVHVRCGDGTLGWPEAAPFQAIVVAAGGPKVPQSLREQLAIGGRLVIPVGGQVGYNELKRVTRLGPDEYREEDLADVRFVPLVGAEGWQSTEPAELPLERVAPAVAVIERHCEAFDGVEDANLDPLLQRIGDARIVLIGEASHGTSEFYALRARITRELIERKGFQVVAVEADWPDAAKIDDYVRHVETPASQWQSFSRFPTWMWRNAETRQFVDWLHAHNAELPSDQRTRFAGLDLYGMYNSIQVVLDYLDRIDPATAAIARERYGCLTPWQHDPAVYGRAALTGEYRSCEVGVVRMLTEILGKRLDYSRRDGDRYFDSVQNAVSIANAEKYYRVMYYGAHESWNLRDRHMFQTLRALLEHHGSRSRVVVWEHNSHVGNAAATDMSKRGELNVGQLAKETYGEDAYSIGFGTHSGTVAAASHWGGPLEIKRVQPSHPDSYERLFHTVDAPAFLLDLQRPEVRQALQQERLQRAIGVIYRPETELASHYCSACLPEQFDEYIWFDVTRAVTPLQATELEGMPETYPFGL